MNNRRFSPLRLVFVFILLGALFMVGKIVNPPPAAPPAPPPPATTPTSGPKPVKPVMPGDEPKARAERDMQMRIHTQQMQERSALIKKYNHGEDLRPDDGTTSKYFGDHSMGKNGLAQAEQDQAREKAITDRVDREMKEEEAKHPHKVPSSDLPTPPVSAGHPVPTKDALPASAVQPGKP